MAVCLKVNPCESKHVVKGFFLFCGGLWEYDMIPLWESPKKNLRNFFCAQPGWLATEQSTQTTATTTSTGGKLVSMVWILMSKWKMMKNDHVPYPHAPCVENMYLHLAQFYGECRLIFHTWVRQEREAISLGLSTSWGFAIQIWLESYVFYCFFVYHLLLHQFR